MDKSKVETEANLEFDNNWPYSETTESKFALLASIPDENRVEPHKATTIQLNISLSSILPVIQEASARVLVSTGGALKPR
mmetsp:Transcript_26447/g.46636  ORF Transcript_26447/g.46636 Transcript_26447/m.46636 type:complete len:80 (+) Transcript_26447:181-420(+)